MLVIEIWEIILFYIPLKERYHLTRTCQLFKKLLIPFSFSLSGFMETKPEHKLGHQIQFKNKIYSSFSASLDSNLGVQIFETKKDEREYSTKYLMELPSTYSSRFFINSDKLFLNVYQEAGRHSFEERKSQEINFPMRKRFQIDSKKSTPKLKGGILRTFEIDVEKETYVDVDYSIIYESGINQDSMHTIDPDPKIELISLEKIQILQNSSALVSKLDFSIELF
jgi:hypothetical protein